MSSPILLHWSGPYAIDQIEQHNKAEDYGLYMIVGTHITHGPETLLYLGKAESQKFAVRLSQHDWLEQESMPVQIYLGRILAKDFHVDSNKTMDEQWTHAINEAERLMIFSLSPHYNSSNVYWANFQEQVVVYNLGRRHRLPTVLDSEFWKMDSECVEVGSKLKYLAEH